MSLERLENFADPFHMLVKSFCIAKYIIMGRETAIVSQETQHLFHTPLEGRRGIRGQMGYGPIHTVPRDMNESSEGLGVFGDKALMIGLSLVEDAEAGIASKGIIQLLYPE